MKIFFTLIIIISIAAFPQTDTIPAAGDTFITADTIRVNDTVSVVTPIDTLPLRRSDVDTVIYSEASDSLIFFVNKREMHIFGESHLIYKNTDLKSANIYIDFNTNFIDAEGVPSDTLPGTYDQTPVLTEQGEVYEGLRMRYNFRTRRGFITAAETELEGARYTGSRINKVDEETYFIEEGIYTTCEIEEPHYHFYAKEMKVIHRQQVVAKWIWLNFGQVPFPVPFPFAVFPIQSGRRSGILTPAFGQAAERGFYFSRFGYFWAMSDYTDWNLTADYFTRGGYNLESRFRYVQRYNFTGNIEGGYSYEKIGEEVDPGFRESNQWRIRVLHNQTIDPTLRFDANLEFISGTEYLQRTTTNFTDLLRNDINSNATIFKSFESGNSLSLSYSRRQDLQSGNIQEVLPNLTFNKNQEYPFRREGVSVRDQQWYELIGYRYSGQFRNDRNKIAGDLRIRGGLNHNLNVSASPKVGYFNITPSFNYNERWYNKRIERVIEQSAFTGEDTLITRDINEINFVRSFNTGVSAQTKFYGFFQPNMLGVSAIRHTVIPSLGYTFTPDFSKPGWGYYETIQTPGGEQITYNKFEREIFGAPGRGQTQNLNFRLDNNFEMKTTVDPTDTTSQEQKIQLLNLSADLGYNFAADSLNFSDLRIGFRSQIGEWVNFNGSTGFSFYDFTETGRVINKFLINEGKGLARLTNLSLSISTTLSGERLRGADRQAVAPESEEHPASAASRIYGGIYDMAEADFTIPWDISLNYNYFLSKPTPDFTQIRSNLSGGLNFNLTPNWKFSFQGSYDFQNKEFAAPQVRISRDLHCWLMNFTWTPLGTWRGYRFEIRVKAPQLQDLKITKADQFYSGKR
jgi:lipopolysaccharide assembly outer membrane protein LptD (OstA)